MNTTRYQIYDLQLRIAAIELLLIARGETEEENLKVFRKEAKENEEKRREEFRQEQWAKITLGSVIQYDLYPAGSSLVFEVISISSEPFRYIAGKIVRKNGKSGYHVGEVLTINSPSQIMLVGYTNEILSRE